MMETISASDAKREFGELILKAQKDPIGINKNGKPVAVMVSVSAYEDFQMLQQQALQQAINQGIDDIEAGRVVDGEQVFTGLRKQVLDAAL